MRKTEGGFEVMENKIVLSSGLFPAMEREITRVFKRRVEVLLDKAQAEAREIINEGLCQISANMSLELLTRTNTAGNFSEVHFIIHEKPSSEDEEAKE
jgi:hypothetical protein